MMLQSWIQPSIPPYVHKLHITVIEMYLYREVCKKHAVVDHVYHLQSFQIPIMSILHAKQASDLPKCVLFISIQHTQSWQTWMGGDGGALWILTTDCRRYICLLGLLSRPRT